MPEAVYVREGNIESKVADAAVSIGELWQIGGKAGYYTDQNGRVLTAGVGERANFRSSGKVTLLLTSSITILQGCRVYWDHSANLAHYKRVNDRDFYAGRAVEDSSSGQVVVDLNSDPPYDYDLINQPFLYAVTAGATLQVGTRAKVGATAGWVVAAADNLPYVATLAASQTGSTLIIPLDGLRLGDTITGFTVISQIESAGGTVTVDGDLRAVTNVAAEPTDASIGTITQVSVTADTASSAAKTGLTEVVTSGKSYYLKITATTAASTDIILQHCEVMVQRNRNDGHLEHLGGSLVLSLTLDNQAQKVDPISVDGFSKDANAIIEFIFRVTNDGAGTVADLNLGVANATHATDFDSVTEAIGVHLDANSTNINLFSRDGVSTPIASTDSTIDYTEGSAIANRTVVWIDTRTPADCQIYINAVLALTATVFNINSAVGPLFLCTHLEKTVSTDQYSVAIDAARAWLTEQ